MPTDAVRPTDVWHTDVAHPSKEETNDMKQILTTLLMLLAAVHADAQQLRTASFNIRYSNGDKGTERRWENRRDSLCRFLLDANLDIIGMQEVLHGQMKDICHELKEYGHVGVGREDGRKKGEYAPIFYRKATWKKLRSGVFWLSETPDVAGSMGWDAACTRCATWILLQHKQSGRQLIVVNTHFDHVGHKARTESARLIMRRSRDIAAGIPLLLTGDFNVDASDEVYTTLTTDTNVPLNDTSRSGAPHEGAPYTFHSFGRIAPRKCSKIDFIFASPAIRTVRTQIIAEKRDSPTPFYMSDHNPIIATLQM